MNTHILRMLVDTAYFSNMYDFLYRIIFCKSLGTLLYHTKQRFVGSPRMKLASCKSALNPPIVFSTDRSKAVVLVLVLLFVALSVFSICVVKLALWSPSSKAAHFAFCFTSCFVMLAFWSPSTAAYFAFCFTCCD